MAKIATVLFAFFYLLVATGFNLSAHWCGNKIRFVSLDSPHEKKCPCGKKMRPGCCKDIHAYFKITDTQKAASKVALPSYNFVKAITFASPQSERLFQQVLIFDITNYHAPPFKTKLPVYLTSGTLRV